MTEIKAHFASQLKKALATEGLSQAELARRLEKSPTTVSRWLSEKSDNIPPVETLVTICKMLSISPDHLLYKGRISRIDPIPPNVLKIQRKTITQLLEATLVSHDGARGRYWNTNIASDTPPPINKLEPVWENIETLINPVDLEDTEATEFILELFMLVSSYMYRTGRLKERINYGLKAADAAHKLASTLPNDKQRSLLMWDEAIIRIDSIGYTSLSIFNFDLAKEQLELGLSLAQQLEPNRQIHSDLTVLARSFLALMFILKEDLNSAFQELKAIKDLKCSNIYEARRSMVWGHLKYAEKDFWAALEHHKEARKARKMVKGDLTIAHYYIGRTYLALEDFAKAEREFKKIKTKEKEVNMALFVKRIAKSLLLQASNNYEAAKIVATTVLKDAKDSGVYDFVLADAKRIEDACN